MKIAIFSPYFRDLISGGGEKHLFEIALVWAEKHQVEIAVSRPNQVIKDGEKKVLKEIKEHYQRFLGKDLGTLHFVFTPLMTSANFWKKLWWTAKYDYLLAVTDGSLFFSLAKKNNLHFQIPFTHFDKNIINQLKLLNWTKKNANSYFTKQVIENNWPTKINYVVHPLIDSSQFKPALKRENIILGVGRFFRQLHSKKQEILIDSFIRLKQKFPHEFSGWKLVLVGRVEDRSYFRALKNMAKNQPVEFLTRVHRQQLLDLMNKAKFFWHAAGFGVNPKINPEKLEHFGIATAESLAAGCVPLVYLEGGQKEVLGKSLKELGWLKQEQLLEKTHGINLNQKLWNDWHEKVLTQAKKFDTDAFRDSVWRMLE